MSEEFDKSLLEDVLQEHYNAPELKIIDYTAKHALGKGENYASIIWRVHAVWQRRNEKGEENMIFKTLPKGEWIKDMVTTFKLFEKENEFYSKIIKLFEDIFRKRINGEPPRFGARYYKTNQPNVLILEDLTKRGFELANRKTGGNFHHGMLVMRALARLHAFSIVAHREDPSFVNSEIFKISIFEESNLKTMEDFFVKPVQDLISEMRHWPKFQKYIDRIKPFPLEEVIKYTNECGKLRVLNQGDCWLNNMMFRLDKSKKPIEVYLLDFQILKWGPLALDLIYFFYTSLSPETLIESIQDLIEEYITMLQRWLTALGEEIGEFTRENILSDLREEYYFAPVFAMVHLNIMMCDSEDAPTMDSLNEMNKENGEFSKIRGNPLFQERLLKMFQIFDKDGII